MGPRANMKQAQSLWVLPLSLCSPRMQIYAYDSATGAQAEYGVSMGCARQALIRVSSRCLPSIHRLQDLPDLRICPTQAQLVTAAQRKTMWRETMLPVQCNSSIVAQAAALP